MAAIVNPTLRKEREGWGTRQTLNLYTYLQNDPLAGVDADGHCSSDDGVCQQRNNDWNTAHEIANFAAGALNAFASDNALGAGRQQQTTAAGQIGAATGDFTAAAVGAGEALLGGGGEVAGLALDATGVGAIAGVPINVASAVAIGQGSAAAVEGVTHLALAASSTSGETSAAASGRDAHKAYDPGAGFSKDVRLPSGKRPDAVNHSTQTVKELKPNNPSAIARGQRQVEGYRQELQNVLGGIWKAVVETYSK